MSMFEFGNGDCSHAFVTVPGVVLYMFLGLEILIVWSNLRLRFYDIVLTETLSFADIELRTTHNKQLISC